MIRQPDASERDLDSRWTPHYERRSAVLRCLRELSSPVMLSELAVELAAWDSYHLDETEVATERDIRTRLHHVDLPKLDDVGLLDYDPSSRVVLGLGDESTRLFN